jgi:hypothetical protein
VHPEFQTLLIDYHSAQFVKKHYSFYKQIINRQRGHSALCQPKEKSILQPRQQRYEHGFSGHFNSTIRTKKSAEIFHIFLAVIILCVYLYPNVA